MNTMYTTILNEHDNNPLLSQPIFGKTIFEHTAEAAAGFDYGEVIALLTPEERETFDFSMLSGLTNPVIVLQGDMPFVSGEVISALLSMHKAEQNAFSKIYFEDGIYSGVYAISPEVLLEIIVELKTSGQYKGFSLEDIFSVAAAKGLKSTGLLWENPALFYKGSNVSDYYKIMDIIRLAINYSHAMNGVRFIDISQAYIDSTVSIGEGTVIYPGSILEGQTTIGKNCKIGPNSKITDMTIGDGVSAAYSVLTESSVGNETSIGPFAFVRPHCTIGDCCKVGDFVEVKNSVMGNNTKASHLTYIGDADVGNNINFGCGTVIVNYDGKNKFRTVIEDDCFVGCNANLVSPVVLKKGSFIAAGSTITEDVPENALGIARARQINKDGWQRPKKIVK